MAAGAGLLAFGASTAHAGAWPTPKGETQLILKAESMRAGDGFGAAGERLTLPADQKDQVLGLFVEHGLTDRITLQLKGEWQAGEDAFLDYEGRGPVELGVRVNVWRGDWSVLSVYAGHAWSGEGRNAPYARPGVGDGDWEFRILAGRSFARGGFIEGQAARRLRDGLPDETRLDLTAGVRPAADWMLLTQVFAGATDAGPRWAHVETSVARTLGDWTVQAGWRETVWGREIPAAGGPVFSLWRRF